MFDEAMTARLVALIDDTSRATHPHNKVMHELLSLAKGSLGEIKRLNVEIEDAWFDSDEEAWRHYSAKALGSLVMMAGFRVDENKALVPAVGGIDDGDVAVKSIAVLAEKYADAMTARDRQRRKERSTP